MSKTFAALVGDVCYQKNFLKEYSVEKERLEIVIKDISDRDGSLYDMKFVVEPNPTVRNCALTKTPSLKRVF